MDPRSRNPIYHQPNILLGAVQIAVGAALYGLITVGGKYFSDRGFSLFEIAFLIAFVPIALTPVLVATPRWRPDRTAWRFFAGFGAIGALLQICQFAGVVLGVPVAVVALLLYSQPIWTTFLGRVALAEPITSRKLLAVVLALLGIALLVQVGPDAFTGTRRLGLAASLAAGLLLSLWVIWGRRSGLKRRHFVTTTFGYGFSSTAWLLVIGPSTWWCDDPRLARFDLSVYWGALPEVAVYTLLAGILPACLVFAGMRSVEASSAGVLMLLEPISAAVCAYVAFGQPLGANVWLGGLCILAANAVVLSGSRRKPSQAHR